jgi:hypothetical protein
MYQQQPQVPQPMYGQPQNYGQPQAYGQPPQANVYQQQTYDQPSAPPPYQPGVPPNISPEQLREEKYRVIISKYEISQFFAAKLQKLSAFKIVFVFDDSGSMNTPLDESPLNRGLMKVNILVTEHAQMRLSIRSRL